MKIDFQYLATMAYASDGSQYIDVNTGITVLSYSIFIHKALYNLNKEYFDAMKLEEGEEVEGRIIIDLLSCPVEILPIDIDEWVIGDDYAFILHPYFAEKFFKDFNQMCDEYRRDRQ
jgi:hypothetical protein